MAGPKPQDVYQGYNASPSGIADTDSPAGRGPRFEVQANPNDFGANVGQALEQAGKTGEQLGDEASDLATHFAQMYADSSARDGVTNASKELSDAELAFRQNKGNNSVNAYKTFQDSVSQIQEKYANSMPNLAAQNKFKDDFSHEASSAIFRSGAYVADQAESAQLTSLKSSIDNNANQFALNANNPTASTYIDKIRNDTADLADHQGITDPSAIAGMSAKHIGTAISGAINSNIRTSPDLAQSIANKYLNGSYQAVGVDKDGNQVVTNVPYVDAQQRTEITNAMQQEFVRQQNQTIQDAKEYAVTGDNYNKAAVVGSMQRAGRSQDDIDAMTHHLDNMQTSFGAEQARYDLNQAYKNDEALAYAGKSPVGVYDPATVQKAFRKDPDKAQDFLNQVNQLHQVAGFVGGMPTRTPAQNQAALDAFAPHGMSIADSIHQQESGGKANAPANGVSVGGWQITPGTFAQYAKPGEDINNPKDNEAVGHRIIDDLSSKFNGDPARIAVGYFSGAGNVAPAGSPTPWINNTSDKNGKSVSSYVADVTGRMSGSQNFGEQSNLYGKMQKAAQDYYKQLGDDPAGMITSNDTKLSNQFQDAVQDTKNPQKMVNYVNAVAARQEALQVPEVNRSVLPKAYAAAIQNDLTANPEQAPDKLAKMARNYGNTWPQVYKSLGLTFQQQTQAHTAEDPMMAQYGAMDAKLGSDDLTKGKTDEFIMGGKENLTAMKDAVTSNTDLQSFMLSMRRSGASPQYLQQIQDQAEHMSMAIKFYDPAAGSIKDATNKAVAAMTHGYGYLPSGDRVPLNRIDSISTNTQFYQQHIGDLVSPQQYVPPTYASREHYIQDLQTSSSFLTDEANQRLLMIDNHGLPVLGLDGKQISVGFNDAAMRKPVVRPPDLTVQPNQYLGRGEIPVKGSLADKAPSFSEIPGIAESAGKKVASGVENLAAKAKERESQGGLAATPNQYLGRGEIPVKGSLADIINEAIK
jgi:hypothetical protein